MLDCTKAEGGQSFCSSNSAGPISLLQMLHLRHFPFIAVSTANREAHTNFPPLILSRLPACGPCILRSIIWK